MIYNCRPIGGISNRLKWMVSSLVHNKSIFLQWDVSDNRGGPGPGVGSSFSSLFVNTYSETPGDGEFGEGSDFWDTSMRWIHTANKSKNRALKEKYSRAISSLVPVKDVRKMIRNTAKKFTQDTATFSVRTFTCFPQEHKKFGQFFSPDNLFAAMDSHEGNMFVTCDDPIFLESIKERYGERVIVSPKRTFFGDNNSIEGMQDILVDLYLGGMNSKIYGTPFSTFTQMQWWFGKCQPEFIPIDLHTNMKVPK
jgi:hypothetical protein